MSHPYDRLCIHCLLEDIKVERPALYPIIKRIVTR